MIRIAGGTVLTPEGMMLADVWVAGDTIIALGSEGPSAVQVVDATGMLVGPGLVDLHTHLREPGQTWKEDIESGTRAAAVGGYTAVVAMPNTIPPIDSPEVAAAVTASGRSAGLALVMPAGSLTAGRSGKAPSDAEALYRAGVRVFTDDGETVCDPNVLAEAMRNLARLPGAVVAQHAEGPLLTRGPQLQNRETARSPGPGDMPSDAEHSVVARDLQLAAESGAHYHVQHVSTAETVALVRAAKTEGLRVTAEVTPHHLSFDESAAAGLDTNFKMYPPLRPYSDRMAVTAALIDGTIDAVATDHAPHTVAEKAVPFSGAPRGVIGLETAAPAVWEVMSDPVRFFEVTSVLPARIAGLTRHGVPLTVGSPANLVVFDPSARWVPESFVSKSSNSPYLGRTMTGRAMLTVFEGTITHQLEGVA
ncbi:MAG: dihydroorotase [Acidimicrobiia bacterium]